MVKINAFVLAVFSLLFTSCEAIGDIFKAGVWVGVVIVVFVIIGLVALFRRKG